uniref:Serine aminopeptidase S33 domain-containing protein n=1 Tax=Prasinoderma coloniale TaxID=156133 RepID=A0A7R9Y7X2_9VIRI|eukprot:PRCOL_00003455-RA
MSAAGLHDGGVRFWSPVESAPSRASAGVADARPLLVLVPGIDGTGFAASRQFETLGELFSLQCMTIPAADRSSALELADALERHCRGLRASFPGRRIYLAGESMGGLLALLAASRLGDVVSHLILVNPASSYARTPWATAGPLLPLLPGGAYEALPLVLSPILLDPAVIAGSAFEAASEAAGDGDGVDAPASALAFDAAAGAQRIGATMSAFQATLLDALPRDTLAHRLKVLQAGADALAAHPGGLESTLSQKVLVVVGGRDALLPSVEEGQRLKAALPKGNCKLVELPEVAHALLQDPSVNLSRIVLENAFYAPSSSGTGGFFGSAALAAFVPPSDEDLASLRDGLLAVQRAVHAPVYLSTQSADGRVVRGLSGLPAAAEGRPVLLVGNHQLMAADLGLLIDEYVQQKEEWLRGLAHPAVFAAADQLGGGGSDASDGSGEEQRRGAGGGAFFRRFGAMPVSGKALHAVLASGQPALLFPGGVREAYKRKGEAYELFWPERAEFVRMAAKFDALVVPFAAVGVEDSMEIVLDSEDQLSLPLGLGERNAARAEAMPMARAGGKEAQTEGETFLAPVVRPTEPDRWYFRFMAPIDTAGIDHRDAEAAKGVYEQVRSEVAEGIRYLRAARESDELRSVGARAAWSAQRAAADVVALRPPAPIDAADVPTFDLERRY